MSLYNKKKYYHKLKEDQGSSFGKSFNYEMGRKKAKEIAEGKVKGQQFRKALDKAK